LHQQGSTTSAEDKTSGKLQHGRSTVRSRTTLGSSRIPGALRPLRVNRVTLTVCRSLSACPQQQTLRHVAEYTPPVALQPTQGLSPDLKLDWQPPTQSFLVAASLASFATSYCSRPATSHAPLPA